MKYTKKQTYIEKFNFGDGNNIDKKGIPGLTVPVKKNRLGKYVYQELKKILQNYSENFPPMYLVDRRTKKDNSKYDVEKRDNESRDRRKWLRRKNNFDRRHPQSYDMKFSYPEDDRRKEFSDRRDWIDIERRSINKREIIKSIRKISELITSFKTQHLLGKENSEKQNTAKPDQILLLIKNHLKEGFPFESEEFIYDMLTEIKSFMSGEKFFCGKLTDNSLGFYYYWIDGQKQYFVKELGKKEFPAKLKIVDNYKTNKIQCCIDFDPFDNISKCNVGICNQYTSRIKKRLQRAELYKTLQKKLKISR